jgi:PilZ domain
MPGAGNGFLPDCRCARLGFLIVSSNRPGGQKRLPGSLPERRYSKRSPHKHRASLIVGLERHPCLVLDSSKNGFRVRGSFRLRCGQVVEITLDDDPLNAVRCNVVWVGKAGSRHEGEIGLETI